MVDVRAGRAGRAGIGGDGQEAAFAPLEAVTAVAEEAAETTSTLEQLRASGDPTSTARTPMFDAGDIPVRPGEWPIGYPLQGVPRVAVTLNLNYVYNEEREEWERDTGFRKPPQDTREPPLGTGTFGSPGVPKLPDPELSTGTEPDPTGTATVPDPSLSTTIV
jgi:hypothetical protein